MTPALIAPPRERPMCPVCGKIAYSAAGIHPQCAVTHHDAKLRRLRPDKKAEAAKRSPFSKRCPRCRREVPARRMVCDCGQSFSTVNQQGSS